MLHAFWGGMRVGLLYIHTELYACWVMDFCYDGIFVQILVVSWSLRHPVSAGAVPHAYEVDSAWHTWMTF